MARGIRPEDKSIVKIFSAYGEMKSFPNDLRKGCQRNGVNLIDIPRGRKDAAGMAIMVTCFYLLLTTQHLCLSYWYLGMKNLSRHFTNLLSVDIQCSLLSLLMLNFHMPLLVLLKFVLVWCTLIPCIKNASGRMLENSLYFNIYRIV